MKLSEKEAIDYIENHTWSTTRLGLHRTQELLEKLGNPQKSLKFVHVAGSNGKGSTCAILYSVLKKAGYKVGLYTSPYLVDFKEQLQVSGELISGDEICALVEKVAPIADAMEDHPSRFELLTAIGMLYFKEKECDIVILEVGMGGELDSTNVIDPPLVAVITNIGLDHTEYLGNTIEEIAAVKAGIIKAGSHVVCYNSNKKAVKIIKNKALMTGAASFTLTDFKDIELLSMDIDGVKFSTLEHDDIFLPLPGRHQVYNAAVALDVIRILGFDGFPVDEQTLKDGFREVTWSARLSVLRHDPLFVLDGGHNPQCAEALSNAINESLPGRKFTMLVGILEDKDYRDMIGLMMPFADEFICVTPNSPRALDAFKLKDNILQMSPYIQVRAYESIIDGLNDALESNKDVICFGSLYMAGEVIENFVPAAKQVERKLIKNKLKTTSNDIIEKESRIICDKLINLMETDEMANAKNIFAFLPMDLEPDLSVFYDEMKRLGKSLAYPVVKEDGFMEAYIPNDEDAFVTDKYGIKAPDTLKAELMNPKDIDVVIVPCLAFDKAGRRLGHGMGYYDRYLPKCIRAKCILTALSAQELPEVSVDSRDVNFDTVITALED